MGIGATEQGVNGAVRNGPLSRGHFVPVRVSRKCAKSGRS